MTIQNWALRPDAAIILCDTIVTDMESNRPMAAMSKAWAVPHRSMMVAAGLWAYPAMTLYSNLALGYGPDRIEGIPGYATDVLSAAASGYSDPQDWHAQADAALFAWNETTNTIEGWRFAASHQYRPERIIADGKVRLMPPLVAYAGALDWRQVALQQQAEDREIADFDRNNIGGSLVSYEMVTVAEGLPPKIVITNFGRLPHFDEQSEAIKSFAAEMGLSPMELIKG